MSKQKINDEIQSALEDLFPLARSITGDANRATLNYLKKICNLEVKEIKSGTKCFDWTVPDEWSLAQATIKDMSGKSIIDWNENNLHVVSYSKATHGIFTLEELEPHLHVGDIDTHSIPYRTSYYAENWGFCISKMQYEKLKAIGGPFEVLIDAKHFQGLMSYGEILISGKSKKEILISTYICHPSMANDNLSGVLLTAFLARWLSEKSTYWSYRIIFVPETIGAIAYIKINETNIKEIDNALIITNVGGPGKLGLKQSWESSSWLNQVSNLCLKENVGDFIKYPFDINGSDERQFSQPAHRINCVSITKDKYYEFDCYHTSSDDLSFVNGKQIAFTLDIYQKLIDKIEAAEIFESLNPSCEVMLSKRELYPKIGGSQLFFASKMKKHEIILWIMFLCDGKTTVDQIKDKLKLSSEEINDLIMLLEDNALLRRI